LWPSDDHYPNTINNKTARAYQRDESPKECFAAHLAQLTAVQRAVKLRHSTRTAEEISAQQRQMNSYSTPQTTTTYGRRSMLVGMA